MQFIKSVKVQKLLQELGTVGRIIVRNHYNKDYMTNPYPMTELEWNKSAAMYGMHPRDYKPYPDDGLGYGDYPMLPMESVERRDPFYPWDYPALKRNFNEILHADYYLIREDRYDVSLRSKLSVSMLFLQFFGAVGLFLVSYLIAERFKAFHPLTPPQYPEKGKCHYTFEISKCKRKKTVKSED